MMRTVFSIVLMIISVILFIPLLLIVLPVWIFVSMCNLLNKRLSSGITEWQEIIQYEPGIGWKLQSGLDNACYADPSGDRGSITTGKDGWPCSYSIHESDIVAFGDSFAFGYGSSFEKTYYNLSKEVRIKPIAAPGYNMVQSLLLMKKHRSQLSNKLVVWLATLVNDLSENVRMVNSKHYSIPFVRKNNESDQWEIYTTHLTPDIWLYGEKKSQITLRFAKICSPTAYSDRVFEASNFLLQEASDICNSVGSELLIITIPEKKQLTEAGMKHFMKRLENQKEFNADLPDLRFQDICNQLNVAFIPGKQILQIDDYKVRDTHWNLKGNQKISNLIEQYYTEYYLKKEHAEYNEIIKANL